jgi:4,5-DOPA dioxygenase extradiol
MNIGKALAPLRDEDVLILGSGYSFHNLQVFFNPSAQTVQASIDFNNWLKKSILEQPDGNKMIEDLKRWDAAPGARVCHPREEHLLPLLMVAAAGMDRSGAKSDPKLVYDTIAEAKSHSDHAVTGYIFN